MTRPDICELMDKAARLSAELRETQEQIMALVDEMATSSAAIALTSAAKALRRAKSAEMLPPSARTDIKSASRIVEAQLGWEAA